LSKTDICHKGIRRRLKACTSAEAAMAHQRRLMAGQVCRRKQACTSTEAVMATSEG